jgi:5-hydroxyisourate hydrolase
LTVARLSTHVLDISRGVAAGGVVIELHKIDGDVRQPIVRVTTNADGRTDAPLLAGERIETGIYELTFHAGDYYRRAGVELANPAFLDIVVVRVGLADPEGHYHVPLLLSPWSYSTYRGT